MDDRWYAIKVFFKLKLTWTKNHVWRFVNSAWHLHFA